MTTLEHIELINKIRQDKWSDSQAFKEALCDFWLEVAKISKAAKLARAEHKTNYATKYNELRDSIKTDAERNRVVEFDLLDEIQKYKTLEAESEELNAIYRAFRILLPKNEYTTDTF